MTSPPDAGVRPPDGPAGREPYDPYDPYRPPAPADPSRRGAPGPTDRHGRATGPSTGPRPPDPRQQAPQRAPAAPPDPEAARHASRRVMHFGLLMLATLVVASLALPWQAASIVFAIAAVVVGIRALVSVWRAGVRGVLVPLLGLGVGFSAIMVVSLATMLALWPLQVELEQCRRDALTIAAQDRCQADFEDSLRELLERAAAG